MMAPLAKNTLTSIDCAKGIIIGNAMAAIPQKLPVAKAKNAMITKVTAGSNAGLKND